MEKPCETNELFLIDLSNIAINKVGTAIAFCFLTDDIEKFEAITEGMIESRKLRSSPCVLPIHQDNKGNQR